MAPRLPVIRAKSSTADLKPDYIYTRLSAIITTAESLTPRLPATKPPNSIMPQTTFAA